MIKPLHALIVDDSEDDSLLIARELRHSGYELTFERVDTPEGMNEALEHQFWDVIIVDYKMPHFTGIDALKIARGKNPDIPFILVSGVIVEEMAVEAMRRGANDCIKKDNLERLTPTIARELQSARERRERKQAQTQLTEKNRELYAANNELLQLNSELETKNKELASINEQLELTNRKLIESRSEVTEKNDMLDESRRKISTLIANLPGMAYRSIHGPSRIMEYLSEGCKELTGYSPESLINNPGLAYNDIIHIEDREQVREQIDAALLNLNPFEIRYRIISKNGDLVWVWEKGRGILDSSGKLIALEGFITDISELIKKDEQIRQIQKMEVIGTLAGGIAHDFNNILGGIIGSVELLGKILRREKLNDEGQVTKYINTIKNASMRASDLIKQLLLLSKKHELKLTPVDLNTSIRHIIDICQSSFPKSIELETGYYFKPAIVMADPTHIEQVILNLCINASHAMTIMRAEDKTQGGILHLSLDRITADSSFCRIHPDAREGCSYYLIQVSDTGVGIDAAAIARLFEPFYSTKKDGEGSGLGLSIVYSIVKQYDGFTEVFSEKGKGTTFFIYIPTLKHTDSFSEPDKIDNEMESGVGVILVVDDEEVMRTIAEGALKECGYTVITAKNGETALEIFRDKLSEIDAVFLDLSMPGLSGKDVFRELKQISPGIKVILSSGYSDNEKIQEMFSMGIDAFIQKPYNLDMLTRKMKEILSR